MITDKAKSLLTTYIADTLILSGSVGQGGNNTSPLSLGLDVPISSSVSIGFSSENTDENVIQVKLEVRGQDITGLVIREAGLSDNATFASGNLLQRVNFDGVGPFANDETLQIYLTFEVE